jgi:transposase
MRKKETALLTEEVLQELYLTNNLTVKEIASQYNLGTATINRLLKRYSIQKSEDHR